jgi:hypothetical protein
MVLLIQAALTLITLLPWAFFIMIRSGCPLNDIVASPVGKSSNTLKGKEGIRDGSNMC